MDRPNTVTGGTFEAESRSRAKPRKACVPCHTRKVKCDAAVSGLPCSGCISRQCTDICVLSTRKRRRRTLQSLPAPGEFRNTRGDVPARENILHHTTGNDLSLCADEAREVIHPQKSSLFQGSTGPQQSQERCPQHPDLHYLNILREAVNNTAYIQRHDSTRNALLGLRQEDSLTPHIQLLHKPLQLDDVDIDYLAKKGVFELPPQQYLETFLKMYFEYVYPFSPCLDRVDFVQTYRSGNSPLFLLYAILAATSLYAPGDVISGCGFRDPSTAQASFFSKARLLYDFDCQSDSLIMLQGSIILGVVVLEQSTDRDFQYWFHNSVRLGIKLDIHNACIRGDRSFSLLKLYRRIWWILYSRDVFHSFVNTQNLRALENLPFIEPITEDDWEEEDSSAECNILSPISHHQKASLIAHCGLSKLFGRFLTILRDKPQHDPDQLMHRLDAWRISLPQMMGILNPNHDSDIYYSEALATSYRFESIMCRRLRRCRWKASNGTWGEWAKQRVRSAVCELDSIARRVLTNGTINQFPLSFTTTIPALLALHIETALDPSEAESIRSMARISISQAMLVLGQLKHIPAIKRGLPAFEIVLREKNLYTSPMTIAEQTPLQEPSSDQNSMNERDDSPSTQFNTFSSVVEREEPASLYDDFLGFGLDRWLTGMYKIPLDFADATAPKQASSKH